MTTTWTIAVDWDRNGDYTGTYDNVTSRVISANWFLGGRTPYQDVADESTLDLTLDNSDKRYSPEYATSPLFGKVRPQRPVRIQSDDGSGVNQPRTHWVGWVDKIEPGVGKFGKRTIRITAIGAMQFLKAAESRLPLQENKRTDQIMADLIKEVVVPPALNKAWVLGRIGNSEVGLTTYLANTSAYSTLDAGALTLGMAADNWVVQGGASDEEKNSFDVYRAIGDITAAEHGKFLFDREGKALFWNRHHLLQGAAVDATFNDVMTDMQYSYASIEQTKNEVIVICHPRKIGTVTTDILWQLDNSVIRVNPGETRTVYIKYEDEGKNRVGAKDVTVTDLEYAAGSATVTVDAKANGAELKLVNTGTEAAIVKKCIIRGRKILDSGEMEAKAVDAASIIDFGRRTLRINLPSIDSLEQAQYIADFERRRRGQPRGEVSAITVLSHGKKGSDAGHPTNSKHTQQLALTLGKLISVQETQSGHSKSYTIIGEAHELTMSATLWKTTWYLEPAPESYPWKLGVVGRSNLGVETRLTY
ncbi:MAG: hypothetical protein JNJ61_06815 [Anaerolineae bacterium]|nr:hypothetical protein [Anaerolineae bacterium]